MSQTFIKNVENFTCEYCGAKVVGNGYTNHCPKCLWSKHVDINPGDRASLCGGMMKPAKVVIEKGGFEVVHRCAKCGYTKQNKTAKNDDISVADNFASVL